MKRGEIWQVELWGKAGIRPALIQKVIFALDLIESA